MAEVVGVLPPNPLLGPDMLAWAANADGQFTTKSAYLMQLEDQGTTNELWNYVWKWKGPYRVQCFMWQVLNKGIKTNENRMNHHIALSDTCPLCLRNSETDLHLLRDCPQVRSTWERLVPSSAQGRFFSCDLKQWFIWNLSMIDMRVQGTHWPAFFGHFIHLIWGERNNFVFKNMVFSSEKAAYLAGSRAREGDGMSITQDISSTTTTELIRWLPPTRWVAQMQCGWLCGQCGKGCCLWRRLQGPARKMERGLHEGPGINPNPDGRALGHPNRAPNGLGEEVATYMD